MVEELKANCKWCFSRLKYSNIGAPRELQVKLKKNSRNNVFKSKEKTNEISRNIFRGFEGKKKVRLIF